MNFSGIPVRDFAFSLDTQDRLVVVLVPEIGCRSQIDCRLMLRNTDIIVFKDEPFSMQDTESVLDLAIRVRDFIN